MARGGEREGRQPGRRGALRAESAELGEEEEGAGIEGTAKKKTSPGKSESMEARSC